MFEKKINDMSCKKCHVLYRNTRIEEEFKYEVVCINQATIAIQYLSVCRFNFNMGRVNFKCIYKI